MADVKPVRREIRRARIAAGLTQRDLAKLAGVAKDTIYRWERGNSAAVHFLELLVAVFQERGVAHGPLWTADEDDEFRVVGWDDVRKWTKWGGDAVRMMRELMNLDVEWNSEWEGDRREFGMPKQWASICTKHPAMWRLIVDRKNKIIGHWHFLTLFDEEFERVKAGKWSERSLNESMVQPLLGSGIYNLYVVIVAVDPKYRAPKKEVKLVFYSLLDALTELAVDQYFFGEVCANAHTPEGAAMCKHFGLSEVGGHRTKRKVWLGRTKDCVARDKVRKDHPQLAELYAANDDL